MRGAKTSPGESNLPLLVMERILVVINAEVSAFRNDSTGSKKKKKKKKITAVEKHRKELAVEQRPQLRQQLCGQRPLSSGLGHVRSGSV